MTTEGDSPLSFPPNRSPAILLCDDSAAERSALAHYLRRQGYDIREIDGGEAALKYLKAHEVDLVLLDLQMPGVNGFDVLMYLQQHRGGLPVILLSGMPVDQIQQEIHALPRHELPPLFLKPLNPDQLLQVLELQLSGTLPTIPEPSDIEDARDAPAA